MFSNPFRRAAQFTPLLRQIVQRTRSLLANNERPFRDSSSYWEERYRGGGNSGDGSYSMLAAFKAEVLNRLVETEGISTVIEHGCGDGNQLSLATYPRYLGFDVSDKAIDICRQRFKNDQSKEFRSSGTYQGETAELALSLDVIFHLVEDHTFINYMNRLTASATRLIAIYSSNSTDNTGHSAPHLRHRRFTDWMDDHARDWVLGDHVPNRYPFEGDTQTGSFADFYIYKKK